MDRRLLLPNQRIDIVDNTRFDSQDGEVIAQSDFTLNFIAMLFWCRYAQYFIDET